MNACVALATLTLVSWSYLGESINLPLHFGRNQAAVGHVTVYAIVRDHVIASQSRDLRGFPRVLGGSCSIRAPLY